MQIHKTNTREKRPLLSFILLDWSVRDHYQALTWLNRQDAQRDDYELIWVDLYDRVPDEAMEWADTVITLGQEGMYHKHKGYNAGLLAARGEIITVCDSDAIFPPDYVDSILDFFRQKDVKPLTSGVLMHYQRRTKTVYPEDFDDLDALKDYDWLDLWPNVGACMSVLREDAVRFGGFDEHRSYRGYICGPYELGWRMVNMGIPETWHDEAVCSYHFSHPAPASSQGTSFSLKRFFEIRRPHVDHHAMNAVEAFSTGRVLPLREHPEIHTMRMERRAIGTGFEAHYATLTGPKGFSAGQRLRILLLLVLEPFAHLFRSRFGPDVIGEKRYAALKGLWQKLRSAGAGRPR